MNAIQTAWSAAKGWRTLAFNIVVAIFGALEAFDFTSVINDAQTAGMFAMFVGIMNGLLRVDTTGPVGFRAKTDEPEGEQKP
jgi:hypothetical protein